MSAPKPVRSLAVWVIVASATLQAGCGDDSASGEAPLGSETASDAETMPDPQAPPSGGGGAAMTPPPGPGAAPPSDATSGPSSIPGTGQPPSPADGPATTIGPTEGQAGAPGGAPGPASGGAPVDLPSGSGGRPLTSGGTSGTNGACAITITSQSLSSVIPTVGIVEWATDLEGLTEASIEFGLDTTYGLTAPVDLAEPNYRTLLLGMKAGGHAYHFRVVASAGEEVCTGEDQVLPPTGEPPNSLPLLTFDPPQASGLDGGFLVFETLKQTFGTGVADSPVYIIDGDGDYVWWYVDTGIIDVGRARQGYDGKHMWISAVNVLSQQDRVIRVNMDGTDERDFTSEFTELNHDFAVHEDGSIAFIAYGSGNCDDIKERAADGTVKTIINSGTAVGASTCHCNAIQYDRNDDTIVFSELETSTLAKVTRSGEVVWVMSAQNPSTTITGLDWVNQHGFHVLGENRLLFFNNNTGPNATAIEAELTLNGGSGSATEVWSYASNLTVQILGDVQRLPNGNTLVTYSTAGEIREVDPSGNVLQTIKSTGAGNLFGFSEKRRSLYGPPPR